MEDQGIGPFLRGQTMGKFAWSSFGPYFNIKRDFGGETRAAPAWGGPGGR